MLLATGLLDNLLSILSALDYFGGIPFRWNRVFKRLELKPDGLITSIRLRLRSFFLYQLLVLGQVVWTWSSLKLFAIIHTIMFLSTAMFVSVMSLVNSEEPKLVIDLFNNMLAYEKRRNPDKTVLTKKSELWLMKLILKMFHYTGILMPTFYHLDVLRNPCFPVYLGFWMSEQCSLDHLGNAKAARWTWSEITSKLGISLVSWLNWNMVAGTFTFYIAMEVFMEGFCFCSFLQLYEMEMCKLRDKGKIYGLAMGFRELQVMSTVYRNLYSKLMLQVMMLSLMVVQTVSMYNSVVFLQNIGNPGFEVQLGLNLIYLWCFMGTALTVVFAFGRLSSVYEMSAEGGAAIRGNRVLMSDKWFSRYFRSCPILRIYFGEGNFLEKTTPLNMEDFVIDQVVSLLLLQ